MGFQSKLLLVFTVLLSVVISLVVFIHYQSEKVLLKNSIGNLRDMVNIVHYSTQRLSTEKHVSEAELSQFLHEVIRKNSIFEVSVIDFDNHVIASTNSKKVGAQSSTQPDITVQEKLEFKEGAEGKSRYEVRIPLVKDKQVEGIVQISILLNDLRSYFWKFSQNQALIFLAALVSAFAVFSLFLRRLHRPFTELAEASKKVAGGDFSIRLKSSGKGEEGEMAEAFNHMTERLLEQRQMEERLNALERRAILAELGASLAHEIRNPLNLMNLTLHHLGKSCRPEAIGKRQAFEKLIESLKTEVQHLNQVVTDFLNLGKPAGLARKRFNLKELVEDVTVRLQQQMSMKRLRMEMDCPESMQLNADQEQLRLVFLNLLLNCIEMVPSDSMIEFKALASPTGVVECSVADAGPGIEPSHLEQVFEPYFSKRKGGMGLGLTLARRIIEEHGGEIRASNRDGGGAVFHIHIPSGIVA